MMRADAFNLHVDSVRTEMTGTQQILILHICDLDKSESKGITVEENSSQVYSTDERKSESLIADEISTEKNDSESVHKSINTNKEKYAIYETEHEEPLVTDNLFINEPRYFNLFKCGKNLLNNLDDRCKRACMATSRSKNYT